MRQEGDILMKEQDGNIWDYIEIPNNAICVTTNGCVDKFGEAIMGAGVAWQAKKKFPGLAQRLGLFLQMNAERFGRKKEEYWNIPYLIWQKPIIFSFPTKPASVQSTVTNTHLLEQYRHIPPKKTIQGWKSQSTLDIIERSAKHLSSIIDQYPVIKQVVLPRPGCGLGGLSWTMVQASLKPILNEKFLVLDYKG